MINFNRVLTKIIFVKARTSMNSVFSVLLLRLFLKLNLMFSYLKCCDMSSGTRMNYLIQELKGEILNTANLIGVEDNFR